MATGASKPSRGRSAVRRRPAPSGKARCQPTLAYRRRMNAIGEALSAVFVGMESPDSDLWGRGLYLKLVGKLYDALDADDATIEDLQALSKMVAEQRRAQTQGLDAPAHFEVFHQVGSQRFEAADCIQGLAP